MSNWMNIKDRSSPLPVVRDILISLALCLAAASLVWLYYGRSTAQAPGTPGGGLSIPAEPIDVGNRPSLGASDANVVIIDFSDFECPYCRRFAQSTLPDINRDYIANGKIKLVFWNVPLPIHAAALGAAVAGQCAREQGRFWQMHDALFAINSEPDDEQISLIAHRLGLDLPRLERCANDQRRSELLAEAAAANALGVTSTPSFLVGVALPDHRVRVMDAFAGAPPVAEFKRIIDRIRASALGSR
jgi:protein-disulfide isomerase